MLKNSREANRRGQKRCVCWASLPDTWVRQGLTFATLSRGKGLGWKILTDLGDDCEREKGILGQEVRMRTGPWPRAETPSGDRCGPHIQEGHLPPQTPDRGDAVGAPGTRPDRARSPAQAPLTRCP